MISGIVSSDGFAISGWIIGAISLILAIRKNSECKSLKKEIATFQNSQNQSGTTVSGSSFEKSTLVTQARDIQIDNR